MRRAGCFLFSIFFLSVSVPGTFAQEADQSDPGVLVSGSAHAQSKDPDSQGERRSIIVMDASHASSNEFIDKSTSAVMQKITSTIKLTPDQISAVEPVIRENIAKVRDLHLSLQKGTIDDKTFNVQKALLNDEENRKLGGILNAGQMKVWWNIQNR